MSRQVKEPKFSERGEPTFKVLTETKSSDLIELIGNYQKDKYKARVVFFNKGRGYYTQDREVLFEYPNGDFKICKFQRTYGISKTSIMYNREKIVSQFLYVKKKFYIKHNNKFSVPSHSYLKNNPNGYSKEAYVYLNNRFSWMRNLMESEDGYSISLNTIVSEKLFNDRKILKHLFKAPWPVIKILTDKKNIGWSFYDGLKIWKEMRQYLINVDNLKPELYYSDYFIDISKMAKTLDKKVNCSWGLRRLKEEHDEWAKIISNIVLESQALYNLNVKKIYRDFADYSGYELLKTNHDLVHEGTKQHHCVATYISSIDNGYCGIYKVKDYTLELRFEKDWRDKDKDEKVLSIGQIRGFKNCQPPREVVNEVKDFILKFSLNNNLSLYKEEENNKKEQVLDIFLDDDNLF